MTTIIYFSKKQFDKLKAESDREGMKINTFIKHIIEESIARGEKFQCFVWKKKFKHPHPVSVSLNKIVERTVTEMRGTHPPAPFYRILVLRHIGYDFSHEVSKELIDVPITEEPIVETETPAEDVQTVKTEESPKKEETPVKEPELAKKEGIDKFLAHIVQYRTAVATGNYVEATDNLIKYLLKTEMGMLDANKDVKAQ